MVISKLLKNNCMMQELWIYSNYIGDDGITTIATALTNSRISQLKVQGCGITLTGARSLAILLSVNQNIRELWLFGNAITTKGAYLILQSAVNNESCQVDIVIDDEYSRDNEVQTLMNILEDRRKMKANAVSYIL